MQMFGDLGKGTIEAVTQFHIMQMFQQQSLSPADIATINFYKPFIAYLQTVDPATRNSIFHEALSSGIDTRKVPLIGFCENAYRIALANNIFTPDQQNQLKEEMAASLMAQANGVTNTSFGSFMKNALTMGLALGVVECMKRVIGDSLSRVVNKIPAMLTFMGRVASKGYNSLCNRPDPLHPEDVMIWRATFEGLINALCEQNISGSLMLKNIRVGDTVGQPIGDENWLYMAEMVQQVCAHTSDYLQERLPYYTGSAQQRSGLVRFANCVSLDNKASIAFLINIICNNLKNIMSACQKVSTADELDVAHIKKLGRVTLLLFDKLHLMITGSQHGANPHGNTMNMEH